MNDIYNYSGNLIIIGGGDIPEEIFDLFSQLIGGKDSPIVVIPTATEDELYIQAAGHLQKFLDRGFNNLNTGKRGYIYNSTIGGATDEAFPQGQSTTFLVGAPYHFYFGLGKGKSAINRYITKYILNQDV